MIEVVRLEENALVVLVQQRTNDIGVGLVGAGGDHDIHLQGAQGSAEMSTGHCACIRAQQEPA